MVVKLDERFQALKSGNGMKETQARVKNPLFAKAKYAKSEVVNVWLPLGTNVKWY